MLRQWVRPLLLVVSDYERHDDAAMERLAGPDSPDHDVGMDHCPHHGEPDGPEAGMALGGTWEAASALVLTKAHEGGVLQIDQGTQLRCEHSFFAYDPRTHLDAYLFRFHVISGTHTGACVLIVTDGNANLARLGLASHP
jgi:hypothetical protein